MHSGVVRRLINLFLAAAMASAALAIAASPTRAAPVFKLPLECGATGGSYVGSTYAGHGGNGLAIDFNQSSNADNGDEVLASVAGTVSDTSQAGQITINHGGGWTTVYAHMASIQVVLGESIEVGELLGFVAAVGNAVGEHLHFQENLNGVAQHPTFNGAPYSFGTSISSTLCLNPPFTDHFDSPFRGDINWLYANNITGGCDSIRYCPATAVTRATMASFLARFFALPATSTDYFTDDEGLLQEGDINRVAAAGITAGCGGGKYCPNNLVLRDQMASFLARELVNLPAVTRDWFTDDNTNSHQANINKLAQAGIVGGCGGTKYCPANPVTREQMAAFLHRAAPYRP